MFKFAVLPGRCSRLSAPQQSSSHQELSSHPVDTSDTASAPDSATMHTSKCNSSAVSVANSQAFGADMHTQIDDKLACSTGNQGQCAYIGHRGLKRQHSSSPHQTSQPMEEDPTLSGAVASIASMARATAPAGPFGASPIHSDVSIPALPAAAAAAADYTQSCSCSCHNCPQAVAADAAPDLAAEISIDYLGQQLEDFMMSRARKMVAQAKKLLPGTLEHAIKDRTAALAELKERYEKVQKQASQAMSEAATKEKRLTEVSAQAVSLQQQLASKNEQLREMNIKLGTKYDEFVQLQAVLQAKERDLAAVNQAMDDAVANLQNELEDVKYRGKELVTFQGLTSPEASQSALNVALKELSDAADSSAKLLYKHAFTRVPLVLDFDAMKKQPTILQQVNYIGLKHAVLSEITSLVFGSFRQTHLTINPPCSFWADPVEEETLLLWLQLEKKRAESWLKVVNAERSSGAGQFFGGAAASITHQVLHGLFSSQLVVMCDGVDHSSAAAELLPVLQHVVSAAMKAQVICSAMHSQLVRLYVPGYLQQVGIGSVKVAGPVPSAWARWPGIMPLAKAIMQPAQSLPAASGGVPRGVDPPAVFCSEPAVIQLAERLGQLPEFGGKSDVQLQPFKVIRKAKMCIAHAK